MNLKAIPATTHQPWGNSKMTEVGPVVIGCMQREARDLLDLSMKRYEHHLKSKGRNYDEDALDSREYMIWLFVESGLVELGAADPEAFMKKVWDARAEFQKKDEKHLRGTAYGFAYWFFRWSGFVEVVQRPKEKPAHD